MTERITLKLEPRTLLGKEVKRLRRVGVTPVHLYGPGVPPQPLQCDSGELLRVLARAGRNTPVTITIDGRSGEDLTMVREVQREPMKGELLHVDFLRVELTHVISAEIPLVLIGESEGAREVRGTVAQRLYHLTVEAMPLDIPHELQIDVSVLSKADSVIRAGDVLLPSNVTLITDVEAMIAAVEVARQEVQEVEKDVEDQETPAAEVQEE